MLTLKIHYTHFIEMFTVSNELYMVLSFFVNHTCSRYRMVRMLIEPSKRVGKQNYG